MIREALAQLVNHEDLSRETVLTVMDEIMSGQTDQLLTAAFLSVLSTKGETIEEISAAATGMRKHALHLDHDMDVLEIVGTGGDRSNSFNISTTSSLVISAAGIPVAKHGNRAASSKCGAADVLEALGVNITVDPQKSQELLEKINICFLFAQVYHSAMKYVGPVRKELGIKTVFNILGPLTNPANANMQLLGVYSKDLIEPMAKVLSSLGVKRGMVVYGQDCLDEISMSAATSVCEFEDDNYSFYEITPEQFGFTRCTKEELVGGTKEENAKITKDILEGKKGPKRDAVILNSAAAIHIAKPEYSIDDAIKVAEKIIDSGKAREQLEKFIEFSNR